MTSGKAGGILGKPLKVAYKIMSRPRRLLAQLHLIETLILQFLIADIRLYATLQLTTL